MSSSRRRIRGLVALSALLLSASVLTACDNGDDLPGAGSADDTAGLIDNQHDQARRIRRLGVEPATRQGGEQGQRGGKTRP